MWIRTVQWSLPRILPLLRQCRNQSMNRKQRKPMSVSAPIQSRTLPLSWKHSLSSIQQLRVAEHLPGDLRHDADAHQRAEPVFGMEGDPEALHQKEDEQHDDNHRADEAQFLAHDTEDKVVGALRQPELLFDAVAKAQPRGTARADGVQACLLPWSGRAIRSRSASSRPDGSAGSRWSPRVSRSKVSSRNSAAPAQPQEQYVTERVAST